MATDYNSFYTAFWKRQNDRARAQTSGREGLAVEEQLAAKGHREPVLCVFRSSVIRCVHTHFVMARTYCDR